jgi:hypothetical protein
LSGANLEKPVLSQLLDDLVKRGLRRPELLIVDGGTGLESAPLLSSSVGMGTLSQWGTMTNPSKGCELYI